MESGRNNGITNLIDLPGLGTGAMFEGKCYGFKQNLSVAKKVRRGRSSTRWEKSRPLSSGGGLAVNLRINLSGWPAPNQWRGQEGTVLVQLDEGRTETLTVRVESFAHSFSEKNADVHDVTLGCTILGDPVYAGFGDTDHTQPVATEPTKADQEQWGEGTTKTFDSNGLLTAATRLTDLWGGTLPDTDSGEATRLAAAVAAATAPMTGLKLKTATFTRDSDDGGVIAEQWALTDSAEDVLNPLTKTTLDANHLGSTATAAAINATPATPAGDSFVARTTTTQELNDAKIITIVEFGLRDTKDDVEMPETVTGRDNSALKDASVIVRVSNTSTPPAVPTAPNAQHVGTDTVALNRIEWKHTFRYANNTSGQDLIFGRTVVDVDPTLLEGKDVQVILGATSTPPATPTPNPTTLKLRRRSSRRVAGTPEQWEHVFYFAATTSQEDVELPKTRTSIDVSALDQENFVCKVFTTGTPPADPTPPAGMVIADYFDVPETSVINHRVYRLAFVNNAQRITLARYDDLVDPNALDSRRMSAVIWDSSALAPADPSAPSGLKLVGKTDLGIPTHPTNRIRVYRWEVNDSVDKIVLPRNWTTADPSNVASEGEVAAFDAVAPAVPAGYKDRGVTGYYQTGSRLLNVRKFGLRSHSDDETMGSTLGRASWDQANHNAIATLDTSASSAAALTAAVLTANLTDKTFIDVEVQKLHDNLARVVVRRQDDIVTIEFITRATGQVYIPARLSGSDVYVYLNYFKKVGQNSGGTARYEGLISPARYLGAKLAFSVSRKVTGASLPTNIGFAGQPNSASFLGLAANTVIYTGCSGQGRIDTGGSAVGVSVMSWQFLHDTLGFFDMGNTVEGYFQIEGSYAAYVSSRGAWVKATDLGFAPSLYAGASFTGVYT